MSDEKCGACGLALAPADYVVQAEKMHLVEPVDGSTREEALPRVDMFHVRCWGQGRPPFREIDSGSLIEVLARS